MDKVRKEIIYKGTQYVVFVVNNGAAVGIISINDNTVKKVKEKALL